MHDLEQAIRERAYHLWIESGRQEGQAEHHGSRRNGRSWVCCLAFERRKSPAKPKKGKGTAQETRGLVKRPAV